MKIIYETIVFSFIVYRINVIGIIKEKDEGFEFFVVEKDPSSSRTQKVRIAIYATNDIGELSEYFGKTNVVMYTKKDDGTLIRL